MINLDFSNAVWAFLFIGFFAVVFCFMGWYGSRKSRK